MLARITTSLNSVVPSVPFWVVTNGAFSHRASGTVTTRFVEQANIAEWVQRHCEHLPNLRLVDISSDIESVTDRARLLSDVVLSTAPAQRVLLMTPNSLRTPQLAPTLDLHQLVSPATTNFRYNWLSLV